jgi:hypothetical protein
MDQLQTATAQGWHRSRPEHYRAILAALESALKQRLESPSTSAGAGRHQSIPAQVEPARAEAMVPALFRWALLPLLALVPTRSHY